MRDVRVQQISEQDGLEMTMTRGILQLDVDAQERSCPSPAGQSCGLMTNTGKRQSQRRNVATSCKPRGLLELRLVRSTLSKLTVRPYLDMRDATQQLDTKNELTLEA